MTKKKQKKEKLYCRQCCEAVKGADNSHNGFNLNFCDMECARVEVLELAMNLRRSWDECSNLEKALVVLAKKLS
jgi:hypothetical protein